MDAAVAAAPAPAAPYRTAAAVLTVAGADTTPFAYVATAVLGPDGSLYVADAQGRAVHRYDGTGRHVATIGRQGRGPGEFEAISGIAVSGDTVFVWDPAVWRISAFDPDGTLLMARRIEPRPQAGWPTRVERAADGTWLYLDQEIASLDDDAVEVDHGIIRATARLVRWSIDADRWEPVVEWPGMQAALTRSGTGEPGLATAPFPRGPLWTADPAGGWWYADNDAYYVTRFSATGDTLGHVVVGMQGPRVTGEDIAAFVSADGRLEPADPLSLERARVTMPERRPVLLDLLTSSDGTLWVGADAGVADSVEWHAFGPDLRMRFRVRLPARSALTDVAGDTLIVVTRDSLDVQRVSRLVVR